MALKMLYRGPSSRLETLIEKIQQNKDSSPDIDSSNTSPSYSPSLPDMASTANFEVDNILNINNNNKITAKQYQSPHSMRSPSINGGKNENILPELCDKQGIETAITTKTTTTTTTTTSSSPSTTTITTTRASVAAAEASITATTTLTTSLKDASQHRMASETRVAAYSPINNTIKTSTRTSSSSAEPSSSLMPSKRKGDCSSRLGGGKYSKINGTSSQLPSNATNSNSVEGSYHCQFCDKSFPRLGYLKKHEQSHAEHMPFKCEYCARLFKHKRSRDRHTKLHTGDRRYRCPHCESAFSRSDHLKIHMKTHDNQKPFQCTVCNRGYNTAAALTSHMQSHKKQAALQRNNTINYSPRSTGSASSSNSLYKRKYSPHIDQRDALNQSSMLAVNAKRFAYHTNSTSMLYCIYCTKNDFENLEQLHAHVQQMHAIVLREAAASPFSGIHPGVHLSCEFCTMKFPSIPAMFQHIRAMHIDRINNPSSYMEHISRQTTPISEATNDSYHRKSNENFVHPSFETSKSDEAARIKNESNVTKSERDTPKQKHIDEAEISAKYLPNGDVKQEDLPTDLSNKKVESKCTENRDDSNDVNNSSKDSPIDSYVNRKNAQKTPTSDYAASSPDPLRCSQCGLMMPNIEAFRDHLRNHMVRGELKNFVCLHCGLSFANQNEYELHVSSHFLISSTEYTCSFGCNKHFTNAEHMQKHLFDEHAQNIWKCTICYESFETKVAIQIHFAMAHSNKEDTFRCSACMDAFETENEFKNHVRTRHSLMFSLPNLQCSLCRMVCSSELEMHFHLATHSRQYRCSLCPEAFHIEYLLERHMQTHHHHHCLTTEKDSALTSYKIDNINNNMFDYNYAAAAAAAAAAGKKIYPFGSIAGGPAKLFDPLHIQTASSAASPLKLPPPLYELYDNIGKSFSQQKLTKHFSNISKTFSDHLDHHTQAFSKHFEHSVADIPNFLNMYKTDFASKAFLRSNPLGFLPPSASSEAHAVEQQQQQQQQYGEKKNSTDSQITCNICERNDFQSEMEMLTHQKIVHNIKTGVSLMCAYCNDNFRSRNELENHMKTAHTGGKHKCLICDEIFTSADILAEHKLTHSRIGVRSKCAYCSANLLDVQNFKAHMNEHGNVDLPMQCICCRQTLNSTYEIDLHAKFHVSTSSNENAERNCALCLDTLPPKADSKVCKKCYEKHNNQVKYGTFQFSTETTDPTAKDNATKSVAESLPEHYCNLCQKSLSNATDLEEHLIEHSFRGCEERGYNCYICSAIFTLPCGLHQHMIEHGPSYRPYDCNLCAKKFYFRAELENHLIDHENGRITISSNQLSQTDTNTNTTNEPKQMAVHLKHENDKASNEDSDNEKDKDSDIQQQNHSETNTAAADDDDEYIEVEQIGETVNHESRASIDTQHSESNDKYNEND